MFSPKKLSDCEDEGRFSLGDHDLAVDGMMLASPSAFFCVLAPGLSLCNLLARIRRIARAEPELAIVPSALATPDSVSGSDVAECRC